MHIKSPGKPVMNGDGILNRIIANYYNAATYNIKINTILYCKADYNLNCNYFFDSFFFFFFFFFFNFFFYSFFFFFFFFLNCFLLNILILFLFAVVC